MIVRTKNDILNYIRTAPRVLETKAAYEQDQPGGFEEIEKELVDVIFREPGRPGRGTDWSSWLQDNLDDMLREAIDIVM